MIKNTLVAIVAATAMIGAAAPAFADTGVFGDGSTEMREFLADSTLAALQKQGVNASSVEEWNGLVRAYVTLEDGTHAMQFFTPDTLKAVAL